MIKGRHCLLWSSSTDRNYGQLELTFLGRVSWCPNETLLNKTSFLILFKVSDIIASLMMVRHFFAVKGIVGAFQFFHDRDC